MKLGSRIQHLFTADFCPGLNRYVYWMKQPIGWYVLATIASLLIGLFHAWSGWVMFAALVAVIGLQLAWPWVQLRLCTSSVSVDRTRSTEGEAFEISLTLTNRSPIPLWGLALAGGFVNRLAVSLESDGRPVSIALSRVPALSTNTYRWTFVPERRGEYPQGQVQLVTGFPFGIWYASRDVELKGACLVWPRTCRLNGIPQLASSGLAASGAMRDRPGDQGDVLGARIWREGESLRQVNWAQSAKTEEDLILMERQSPAQPKVVVHLDLTPHPDTDCRTEILDWQIRIAATLARHLHGHRHDITVTTGSQTRRLGSGREALNDWFDYLALLEPNKEITNEFHIASRGSTASWAIAGMGSSMALDSVDKGPVPVLVVRRQDLAALPDNSRALVIVVDDPERDPFDALEQAWREWCRVRKVA